MMRTLLLQAKDTIHIIACSMFPVFILVLPTKGIWSALVSFLLVAAMVDTCTTIFLCGAGIMYASTIKDALGALAYISTTILAVLAGPTSIARSIICCFFAVAFVVDASCLVSAAGECYNIYTHRLKPPLRVDTPVHVL